MRRRALGRATAALLCALLIGPHDAAAQTPTKVYRVGWLGSGSAETPSPSLEAFRQGMRSLGHVEGTTYVIEPRWWNGRRRDLPGLIDSLVTAKPDVIVAQGPTVNLGARNITQVPVVFNIASDPVSAGIARSLGHPGGNLTGRTLMSVEINGKRLGLLREVLPRIARIALVYNYKHPGAEKEMAETRATARRLGLSIDSFHVQTVNEIDPALRGLKDLQAEAIIVLPDALLTQNRARLIAFASGNGIPLVSGWAEYARSGALMSYGPSLNASYRLLAFHVDKILNGAKPADLPIERPTEFELVVNLRTARALGITVPPSILLRADEVIE